MTYKNFAFAALICFWVSCSKDDDTQTTQTPTTPVGTVINVDATNFLTSSGAVTITTENRTLSNGATAACYKIVTKSTQSDLSLIHI